MLGTALLSFSSVVLLLVLRLGSLVARQTRNSTANGASGTIRNARAEIAQLTTSLLLLTLEILLATLLLNVLQTQYISPRLASCCCVV